MMASATQQNNVAENGAITADIKGTKDGKKRARKDIYSEERRERKRVKVDEGSSERKPKAVKVYIKKVPKPKEAKGKAQSKTTSSKENSTTFTELKWSVVQPIKAQTPLGATQPQEQLSLTKLKPRIWTSSREELVVLLPDLAGPKCLNGVSWLMYDTPMVLLDDSSTCFDIALQEDSVTLDLLTTREFIFAWPPRTEDPPESLTVNGIPEGNCSNLGARVISSRNPTTTTTQAIGSIQTRPGVTLIDVSAPLPTYTPHELSTIDSKPAGSEQKTSEDVLIDLVAPSMQTYSQSEVVAESASEPNGTGSNVLNGPFSDFSVGRKRRTTVAGKRTPEGPLIDFSPPSVPGYTAYTPIVGGFGEPLRKTHSNRGIGNTATKHQHEASSNSIRPQNPTTKFREQKHSTNALVSTDPPLHTREDVPGDRSQEHHDNIGQAELVKNPPLTPRPVPYETRYMVKTNTSYTTPEDIGNLLTQAAYSLQHSPSSSREEPDNLKCSISAAAIPADEVVHAQPSFANIVLKAGPAPQVQSTLLAGVKVASPPDNHIAVTDNRFELDLNKLRPPHMSQTAPLASKPYNPSKLIPTSQASSSKILNTRHPTGILDLTSQTHTESKKHEPSQKIKKHKETNRSKHQPTTHVDLQVDSKPEIKLQATETVESASDEAKVKCIQDAKALQDSFVPSMIPEELQAIIDSYLSGRPVLLVISNKRFFDYWSLRLPEEFGFSMLGYFRILGVQESPDRLDDPVYPPKENSGSMTGRVKWCFRLQWSPGGEKWILPNHDKNLLEYPWWKPPPLVSIPQIPSLDTCVAPGITQGMPAAKHFTSPLVVSNLESRPMGHEDRIASFEPEETFDTTPRYRAARLSHVNYRFRHHHLEELYHSHVPLQLLAPYGRTVLDSSFPRGWLCESCGKMNFQAALRHRACSSSFCKGVKPEIVPYAIELRFMRDPQDNLSMVLPYNEPLLIDLVDTWEDGTRTLPYYIHDDENIFIKHIFTRNLPSLQLEATRLLHFIQTEVKLVRPIGENSPYFQYSAHAPKDDPSPTTSKWPNAPLPIHHAKDWTQHQASWFGELKKEQLSINHICLLAWVTSGTKRGPAIIHAKEKSVIFHAFGCDITVMVTPLSSKATAPVKDGADLDFLTPVDNLPPDEPDMNPGWIAGLDEENEVEYPSQEDKERWPAINSKKASNSNCPFLFTLVHGDVLVFYGDDFEYSLKRAGTSFLLIASHLNEPCTNEGRG